MSPEEIAEAFIGRVVEIDAGAASGRSPGPRRRTSARWRPSASSRSSRSMSARPAERGAGVLRGGGRVEGLPGYFLAPTVLAKSITRMKIMTEETFGPVLPIMAFRTRRKPSPWPTTAEYGLTASVWTRDRKAAQGAAERLEAGTVTVNDHMISFTEPGGDLGRDQEDRHGPVPWPLRAPRDRQHQVRLRRFFGKKAPHVVVPVRGGHTRDHGKSDPHDAPCAIRGKAGSVCCHLTASSDGHGCAAPEEPSPGHVASLQALI